MATIQEETLEGFFTRLSESEGVNEEVIEALRALFESAGKLKADDLVAVYVTAKKQAAA